MDPKLLPFALADVPRYTSYPTAVQFNSSFRAAQADQWLDELTPNASLSIYVHIPFCRQLCWYCGCHTSIPNSYERAKRYVEHLIADIRRTAGRTKGDANRVRHLHFGGGTPTYLADSHLAQILEVIEESFEFAPHAELALESDPRTLTRDRAKNLASLGFNRVSFGVQDFAIPVQMKINRLQPFGLVKAATEYLREAGFKSVNFDLMYGLPGQTEASVINSSLLAASLKPDRIAVFGYAHVPWFKKHQQMISDADLPGVQQRYAQATAIAEILTGQGYEAIGLDHFALPDDELAIASRSRRLRRNFQGYTTDSTDSLLSFGASAISELPRGFFQAARDILDWSSAIHNHENPVNRGLARTTDDICRGEIIERLMCDLQVDYISIAAHHGFAADCFGDIHDKLVPLIDAGIVQHNDHKVTMDTRHRLFLRSAAAVFDSHFNSAPNRHAKAV